MPAADKTHHLHLVCGGTGAGKTTYALALAEQIAGVRFSIDDWMGDLFWMDSPEPMQFEWNIERIGRCEKRIFALARELAAHGVPSILEIGCATAAQRKKFANLARDAGLTIQLHYLDVPKEERWRRVTSRNAAKGETFRLEVTREMFDLVESLWEPPDAAEMATLNGIRVSA
ncbi:MAG TPA: ATP-binding protein [Alphaproteobacteria bacterium]|nr:ATP-binding protein [Alphaproteobacteria bacterium]